MPSVMRLRQEKARYVFVISLATQRLKMGRPQGSKVFVTFVTAGFPTREATIPIMLAMQAGGADIIELGMPFSDPIGDGVAIQGSNTASRL